MSILNEILNRFVYLCSPTKESLPIYPIILKISPSLSEDHLINVIVFNKLLDNSMGKIF